MSDSASGVIGSFSATTATVLLQPLDVMRTRLQQLTPNSTIVTQARSIYSTEGIGGFWRGSAATALRVAPGSGIYFLLLTKFKRILSRDSNKPLPAYYNAGISFSSRIVTAVLLSPVSVVKTRQESSLVKMGTGHYGLLPVAKDIYQTQGFKGFYRGLSASLIRDAPFSTLYYTLYSEFRRRRFLEQERWNTIVSSGMASLLATLVTQPADVLRTQILLYGGEVENRYWGVCKKVYTSRGVRGFYIGTGPRLIKRVLAGIITWTIFEELTSYLRK